MTEEKKEILRKSQENIEIRKFSIILLLTYSLPHYSFQNYGEELFQFTRPQVFAS